MTRGIFRSAVTGSDGEIDSGYLAMFWGMVIVLNAIPFMCVFAAIGMWLDPVHKFDVQGLGIGIGSVCGGFGVFLGAVGAFRMGDRERMPVTTTTTSKTVTEEKPAPPVAPVVSAESLIAAGRGVEPLNPKIQADDVGKHVALVSTRKTAARKKRK